MTTTGTRTKRTNLREEVKKADPNWERDKTVEVEYRLPDGRIMEARTSERGPYSDD